MFKYNRRSPHFYNGYLGQMMHGNPLSYQPNTGVIRNFPYPYPDPLQSPEWQSYQPQNPYYPQAYQQMNQAYQPNIPLSHPGQAAMQQDSQFLFKNPLQPQEEMFPPFNHYPPMGGGLANPYPRPNLMAKQPGGMQSLMNSFKSQDGSVDFNKMMNAAGQMMNAVTQVTSLVKGLGGIFKV